MTRAYYSYIFSSKRYFTGNKTRDWLGEPQLHGAPSLCSVHDILFFTLLFLFFSALIDDRDCMISTNGPYLAHLVTAMTKATRDERKWTSRADRIRLSPPHEGNDNTDPSTHYAGGNRTREWRTGREGCRINWYSAGLIDTKQGKTRLFAAMDGLLLASAVSLHMPPHTSVRTVHPLSAVLSFRDPGIWLRTIGTHRHATRFCRSFHAYGGVKDARGWGSICGKRLECFAKGSTASFLWRSPVIPGRVLGP